MAENGVGASVRRKEDHRFLTGKGSYTDDLNVVGQTHAYFVRSPHAHATINNINTSAALAASFSLIPTVWCGRLEAKYKVIFC